MILDLFFVIAAATGLGFAALGIRFILDSRKARRQQQQATTQRVIDIIRRAS